MRILMTSDAAGGVGIFARELALGLRRRGHAVLLAVMGARRVPAQLGIPAVALNFGLEWESTADPDWLEAQQAGAEIIHANQFAYVGASAAWPALLTVHSDVFSWWRAVHGAFPPETPFSRWYRSLALAALSHAGTVVTPTHAAALDLRKSYGFAGAVGVIANGIGDHMPGPLPKRNYAVSLGRWWDEAKQVGLLLQPDLGLDLFLAGESRAGSWPARSGISFLGPLPHSRAQALLRPAAVFLSSSAYEPFGLAVLEAARAGCALLLNDGPSFRELWDGAALFFVRNSASDLSRCCRALGGDTELCRRLGAAARRRATRYSRAAMAAAYEAAYQRLLYPAGSGTAPVPARVLAPAALGVAS